MSTPCRWRGGRGNHEVESYALTGLGKAHRAAGRPDQAREHFEAAAAFGREHGETAARAWLLKEIANLDPATTAEPDSPYRRSRSPSGGS